jgi:predicted GIY-YIG superfamily endonuclease
MLLGTCGLILISELVNQFLGIELQSFAEYIYNSIISDFTVSCEGVEDLPRAMEFKDLHLTESLKEAKEVLKDTSGIYCMAHTESGTMYIGSSTDLGRRLCDHILNNSSNLHLQRAMALYGLSSFVFIVVEFCTPSNLLNREQLYLNWLFRLPLAFRYNFCSTAGSCLGYQHTSEFKARMSGAQNPAAVAVIVTDLNGAILGEFSCIKDAALFMRVKHDTAIKALRRGTVLNHSFFLLRAST